MEGDDSSAASVLAGAADVNWMSFCLVLVILMQAGFAAYEVRDQTVVLQASPSLHERCLVIP